MEPVNERPVTEDAFLRKLADTEKGKSAGKFNRKR
jgi:hypothetical protein